MGIGNSKEGGSIVAALKGDHPLVGTYTELYALTHVGALARQMTDVSSPAGWLLCNVWHPRPLGRRRRYASDQPTQLSELCHLMMRDVPPFGCVLSCEQATFIAAACQLLKCDRATIFLVDKAANGTTPAVH